MTVTVPAETVELLNLVPLPVGLAKPVLVGEDFDDLELIWANSAMRSEAKLSLAEGVRLAAELQELRETGWVEQLKSIKAKSGHDSRFITIKNDSDEKEVIRLVSAWHGDLLVFTMVVLSHDQHDRDDAIRAASIISHVMPRLPIAYGIRAGESKWLRFPTQGFLENLGISEETYSGQEFVDLIHGEDLEKYSSWLKIPFRQRPLPLIFRLKSPISEYRWVELWAASLPNPGEDTEDVVIVRDVDNQIRLQEENRALSEQLQDQLDLVNLALDASVAGFAIWKARRTPGQTVDGFTLVFMNQAGAAATGKTASHLIGLDLAEVVGIEESKGLYDLFAKSLLEDKEIKQVVPVNSPTGWVGAYENTVVPLSNDQVVTSYRDVSDEQREHQRLVWLTEHDFLTGMPNRSKLESFLKTGVEVAKARGTKIAFIFIDIDHFKKVNDTYGHDIGDALLVNFVKRIRHSLPEDALVARISGDEFAIVIENLADENHLKSLIEEVFSAMRRPFNHNTPDLSITCSAGCILTDGSEKPQEIMRMADKAMYRAKYQGRNRYLIEQVIET